MTTTASIPVNITCPCGSQLDTWVIVGYESSTANLIETWLNNHKEHGAKNEG